MGFPEEDEEELERLESFIGFWLGVGDEEFLMPPDASFEDDELGMFDEEEFIPVSVVGLEEVPADVVAVPAAEVCPDIASVEPDIDDVPLGVGVAVMVEPAPLPGLPIVEPSVVLEDDFFDISDWSLQPTARLRPTPSRETEINLT